MGTGATPLRTIAGLERGDRNRRVPLLALVLAATALLAACGKKEAPPPPPPPDVTVLKIEPHDAPVALEYIAQTQSPQEVNIVARVNGFLDKQLYTEGAVVKTGQVLFQMDQKPFIAQLNEAQAGLEKAKAAYDTALANLNRVKPLAAQNALSAKDLDDATGTADSAAASLAAARANVETAKLNLSYTTIASPLNGISGAAQQKVGAYLNPANSLLTTVSSLNPMWITFSISQNELADLRKQIAKGLIVPPKNQNYVVHVLMADASLYPETGRITFINPSYDPRTGTFLLRATVANPNDELRPNQYVRVRVTGAVRPNAILVPQRAVQQGAKGQYVWVVDNSGKAETRPVVVGDWSGDQWVINDGLRAGDLVVVDGALQLRNDITVKSTPYEPGKGQAPAEPGKGQAPAKN
jgi:membrane fusion protein (multidrug efflux system)